METLTVVLVLWSAAYLVQAVVIGREELKKGDDPFGVLGKPVLIQVLFVLGSVLLVIVSIPLTFILSPFTVWFNIFRKRKS
jgi:hypothetical protein